MNPTFFHVATMKLSSFHKNSPQTNDMFKVLLIQIIMLKNPTNINNQPTSHPSKKTTQPTNQPTIIVPIPNGDHRCCGRTAHLGFSFNFLSLLGSIFGFDILVARTHLSAERVGFRTTFRLRVTFCWETNWATWTKIG